MKNKGFGHLKVRLFTIKTSKNIGLGGPWYICSRVPCCHAPPPPPWYGWEGLGGGGGVDMVKMMDLYQKAQIRSANRSEP